MDWQSAVLLALLMALVAILLSRAHRGVRRSIALIVALPGVILILRWTIFKGAWLVTGSACLIALALFSLWWFLVGRRLPSPQPSQIRVITEEDEEEL